MAKKVLKATGLGIIFFQDGGQSASVTWADNSNLTTGLPTDLIAYSLRNKTKNFDYGQISYHDAFARSGGGDTGLGLQYPIDYEVGDVFEIYDVSFKRGSVISKVTVKKVKVKAQPSLTP